ncbi:hypothetical protein TREMEDRAFT_65578 [Tremella mesenterica DSM 1558]|uniref:uncharacterized protein n=1 Tax=Tremella mesenterica (strain ATCC 24925 / CBS 8224 / DSM 1558 / NBRC 9311 / NRRL Y-6157 / RJB 2259-6 / UBC 559-6) TaxID=578456 RepID=UPI00032CD22B|nr:uncharacterized protein TREMEDRAFT_65578 [Tremella mesenterica DSM 1558]EIW66307.1 hypothetical protein TREMEDRAFT_65578 [Tremella mesenterica DSM 1558]
MNTHTKQLSKNSHLTPSVSTLRSNQVASALEKMKQDTTELAETYRTLYEAQGRAAIDEVSHKLAKTGSTNIPLTISSNAESTWLKARVKGVVIGDLKHPDTLQIFVSESEQPRFTQFTLNSYKIAKSAYEYFTHEKVQSGDSLLALELLSEAVSKEYKTNVVFLPGGLGTNQIMTSATQSLPKEVGHEKSSLSEVHDIYDLLVDIENRKQ